MENDFKNYNQKIYLSTGKERKFVFLMDILYITSDKPYTKITFIDHTYGYVRDSILYFTNNLPSFFFRCNKSTIVNLCYVGDCIYDKSKLSIKLSTDCSFKVSRNRKMDFFKYLMESRKYMFCSHCINCDKRNNCLQNYH